MGKALHGKARVDRNTRGRARTSAKTDVFVHEFLRDPLGMKSRFAEIVSNPKYEKRNGAALSLATVRSWYQPFVAVTLFNAVRV